MARWLVAVVAWAAFVSCGTQSVDRPPEPPTGEALPEEAVIEEPSPTPPVDAGTGLPEPSDAGAPDAGDELEEEGGLDAGVVEVDAGVEPDAGRVEPDAGTVAPDAGEPLDAGAALDAGAGNPWGAAGPWPNEPVMNYSTAYGLGSLQSVGVDDGQNIWLLNGARIGVLRAGTSAPVWVSSIGQASQGFGGDKLATGSTVICGGAAGRAYVGYATYDHPGSSRLESVDDPEFQKGDLDAVKLTPEGTIALETHVSESVVYAGAAQNKLGLRNSNDWHYDEDRSVLVCEKVTKGPNKGDVFVGTNHGVTMVRGLVYNSHRHPSWYNANGSLMLGYNYALGMSFDGTKVLIANDWKVGISAAPGELRLWDRFPDLPWLLDTHNDALNSLEEFDFWRGFTETRAGRQFLASDRYGLWEITRHSNGTPIFVRVSGLPTSALGDLQATEDGSLFIATSGHGLYRMAPDGTFSQLSSVQGSQVKQLVYDPTVTPPSLYVLTNAGLQVVRGY